MQLTEQLIQKEVDIVVRKLIGKSSAYLFEISIFKQNRNSNVHNMYLHLKNGSYKISKLSHRKIPKSNGTHRTIYSANFQDVIVLSLVYKFLQEIYEKKLPDSAIAFRKGMNRIPQAIKIARRFFLEKYQDKLMIKTDIKDFYNHVDTNLLLSQIREHVDQWIFEFFKNLFDNYPFLPQGLSPMNILANIYLTDFDNVYEKKGALFPLCR